MQERRLRRRRRRLLDRLGACSPLEFAELRHRIGQFRGRSIRVMGHPLAVPGPFGMRISTDQADHIDHRQPSRRAHQQHIIQHIAGHHNEEISGQLLRTGPPSLDSVVVDWGLRRTSYDSDDERTAETIATIIVKSACPHDGHVRVERSRLLTAPRMNPALDDRWVGL